MAKELICQQCGKTFIPSNYGRGIRKFCSRKCRDKYNLFRSKRYCRQCGKEYHSYSWSDYCSDFCKDAFQKENFSVEKTCKECGKSFTTMYDQLFCSIACKERFYDKKTQIELTCAFCGKKYTQRKTAEDKRKKLREAGIEALNFCSHSCIMGYLYKTNKITAKFSSQHKLVNSWLEELAIEYSNEYNIKNFSLDIKLKNYNKAIEVMGSYWHGDSRKYLYSNLEDRQLRCIEKDKRKLNIINNENINILYLWQEDIVESPKLCKQLLQCFINTETYNNTHSSNYTLCEDKLVKNTTIQYMEQNII